MRFSKAAAVAVTTAALALGVSACNDDVPSTNAANPAVSAAPAAAHPGAAAQSGAAVAPGGRTSAKPGAPAGSAKPTAVSDRCHTSELKADVQLQPDFPGKAMVMLTNIGKRSCSVYGYLGYGGLLADNSRVTLNTSRVAYPGPSVAATLKPGTTAFSGLKWSSCDKSDPTCHVLAGVIVTPPDETTQLTANVLDDNGRPLPQLTVSAAGFTVGTLQPSNEGVVFTS
ncbi:DUF4232 domain-containing protein [Kitasatospora sp. NBC_01266]|uniref:DUF4232 domain-containing protein n=1 Tax=Kitasatospora sp. NBC_01266 TaxID=2903572 RepID=UPI002E37ED8F|nr:DUF4232 domain-containing protein [Kitasatospora sp. NBC_01266]